MRLESERLQNMKRQMHILKNDGNSGKVEYEVIICLLFLTILTQVRSKLLAMGMPTGLQFSIIASGSMVMQSE